MRVIFLSSFAKLNVLLSTRFDSGRFWHLAAAMINGLVSNLGLTAVYLALAACSQHDSLLQSRQRMPNELDLCVHSLGEYDLVGSRSQVTRRDSNR